jgi:hypothetical protein
MLGEVVLLVVFVTFADLDPNKIGECCWRGSKGVSNAFELVEINTFIGADRPSPSRLYGGAFPAPPSEKT